MPTRVFHATAVWVTVAVLAGGSAVAASHGLRQFNTLAGARHAAEVEAGTLAQQVVELRRQVQTLQGVLSVERRERAGAQRALVMTRALLRDVLNRLEQSQASHKDAAAENHSLRACLAGMFEALPLLSAGDSFRAMHVMMTVETSCRTAQQLLAPADAAGR